MSRETYTCLTLALLFSAVALAAGGCGDDDSPAGPSRPAAPKWTVQLSGARIVDVWGSSSSDVFAVGVNGTILHYDGTSWSAMTSGTTVLLYGIWGSSASDVFAAGVSGTILHYNGTTWSAMTSGTGYSLYGIWGSSGSDVFAVGECGTVLHYGR